MFGCGKPNPLPPLGRLESPRTIREVLGDSLHTFSSVRKYDIHCLFLLGFGR